MVPLRTRARSAFFVLIVLQLGWWIWATILATRFRETQPTYDWVDSGFGAPFALFLFLVIGFQTNYLFLYFIIGNIAQTPEEVVRLAALLRGTESAAQAVAYGLNAVPIFASVGGFYLNFGLWAVALVPAWLVISKIGTTLVGPEKLGRGVPERQEHQDLREQVEGGESGSGSGSDSLKHGDKSQG